MPCDEGRNQSRCLFSGNGTERGVAIGAPERSVFSHVKAKGQFIMELTELVVDVVARDQSMTATEHSASRQISVAREQPAILAKHTLDQHLVRDDLFVRRVIPEDAEPPREATEHRIGHKSGDWLIGRSMRVQGAQPPSADLSILLGPEPDSVDHESLTIDSEANAEK
jgi:hypothetical protein